MSDGDANGEPPGNRPVRESGVSGTGGDVSSVSSERCEALRGRARTKVRWSQGTGVGVSISLRVVQSARQCVVKRRGRTKDDVGETEEREEGAAGAEELPRPGAAGEDAEAVDDERKGDDEVDDGEARAVSAVAKRWRTRACDELQRRR